MSAKLQGADYNRDYSLNIKVYNHLGKLIITETNATRLDLSNYADGIYYLHITLNDKTIIKKAELKIYEKTFSILESSPSSDCSTISEDLVNDL